MPVTDAPSSPEQSTRVTIVVPVYGDWTSLRTCILSLIAHADPNTYDVLLVNDCGPDADEIEAGILGLITRRRSFRYVRNPQNLGFVGTCNRAVTELDRTNNDVLLLNSDTEVTAGALDEMREVLALNESYGVVCPRSNDATIATIPFFRRKSSAPLLADRARAVFDALSQELPRFYIAPVSVGFCLLIRRGLISVHGLFDPIFGAGYSEENDLCLRLNQHGINSLIANHAFVYHVGSSSFGSAQRAALDAENSRIVRERYPHYPASVVSFVHHDYHPVDRFADLLVDEKERASSSILILLDADGDLSKPEVRYAGSLLHSLLHAIPAHIDVTIAANATTFAGLGLGTTRAESVELAHLESLYDLGVVLSLVTSTVELVALNRHCLRWLMVDADSSRLTSWEVRVSEPQVPLIAAIAMQYGDEIVWRSTTAQRIAQSAITAPIPPATSASHPLDSPDQWWSLISSVLTKTVQIDRLVDRNRSVRGIGIAADAARQQASLHERRVMHASRAYRLAQRFSVIARGPRAIFRRN